MGLKNQFGTTPFCMSTSPRWSRATVCVRCLSIIGAAGIQLHLHTWWELIFFQQNETKPALRDSVNQVRKGFHNKRLRWVSYWRTGFVCLGLSCRLRMMESLVYSVDWQEENGKQESKRFLLVVGVVLLRHYTSSSGAQVWSGTNKIDKLLLDIANDRQWRMKKNGWNLNKKCESILPHDCLQLNALPIDPSRASRLARLICPLVFLLAPQYESS